jgi:hypothetical protein
LTINPTEESNTLDTKEDSWEGREKERGASGEGQFSSYGKLNAIRRRYNEFVAT